MTIAELALVTAVLLGFMVFVVEHVQDQALDAEAQQIANVIVSVHDASERYIQDEYPRIAQCFDTEQLLDDWSTDPDGGQSTPFLAVPLYRGDVDSGSYAAGASEFLGRPTTYRSNASYESTVGPEDCPVNGAGTSDVALRSMADVGLLPAGLQSLEYTPGDDAARRWGTRGLDFRLVVRILNANTHSGPDGAVRLQVQGLVVARNAFGVFMPLDLATRAAKLTKIPEAGVISSVERTVGGVDARTFLTGSGGGWRFVLCRSFGAIPGSIDAIWDTTVPNCTGAGSPGFGELPIALAATGHQDALTAAIFEVGGGRNADPTGRTSADDPPGGRVVALVTHTPHDQLHQVLYADDVGIPRLNRMRTHLDLGGFGMPGAGFIAATDRDGDGAIDSRLHIIGDTRLLNADPADDPSDDEYSPVVVHGMLHVTGGIQVGGRQLDQRLREGDIYVAGASVVGGTDDGCPPVPAGTDPSTAPCNVTIDGTAVNRRDDDTALIAFPATRGSHTNPEGSSHDLEPGDQRVRGTVEMIDRAFAGHGIEVIGGRFVVASAPGSPRYYTRPNLLHALSSVDKMGVDSGDVPATAAVTTVDGAGEARGEDGNIYFSPAQSVLATAGQSIWLDPERALVLQPHESWAGRTFPDPPATGPDRVRAALLAHAAASGEHTVLDPDLTYLAPGDLGRAGATHGTFAGLAAPAATFGAQARPPRVLTASLPDYQLVDWESHQNGAPVPYASPVTCPPGMTLVATQGPGRFVVPTGWSYEVATPAQMPFIRHIEIPFVLQVPAVDLGPYDFEYPHEGAGTGVYAHPATQTVTGSTNSASHGHGAGSHGHGGTDHSHGGGSHGHSGGSHSHSIPGHNHPVNDHPNHQSHSLTGFSPRVPEINLGPVTLAEFDLYDPPLGWGVDPVTGANIVTGSATPVRTWHTVLYHCTVLVP